MNILAIETSCDETAVAFVQERSGQFSVVENLVSSQIKIHAPFGGVVPNLAAREHLRNLPLLLKKLFKKHKIGPKKIDLIAVTQGPGLIPALLIGTNAAKSLAYAWKKPLVGVHHIAGHIYANFIESSRNAKLKNSEIKFPILALIVSGGHTQLLIMKEHMKFEIVGETLDDAVGEAFDKVARILNLGYPGGPAVAAKAAEFEILDLENNFKFQISNFKLPRPMLKSDDLNFSFSGLKTAVLYTVKENKEILKNKKMKAALSAEFQQAVIDVLLTKTLKAAKKFKPKSIVLGGGVSANTELRKQLGETARNFFPEIKFMLPETQYSLDNAVMIAIAGYFQYKFAKSKSKFLLNWKNLEAEAGLELSR